MVNTTLRSLALPLSLLVSLATPAWAANQQAWQDSGAFSLEDLLGGNVVSATRTTQTIRERHYRTLAEALRTVPGFAVLSDHFNAMDQRPTGRHRQGLPVLALIFSGPPT